MSSYNNRFFNNICDVTIGSECRSNSPSLHSKPEPV